MKRAIVLTLSTIITIFATRDARACVLPPWWSMDNSCSAQLTEPLNDMAMIYEDAKTPGCDTNAQQAFAARIQALRYSCGGWSGFLVGGQVWFAYQTGLVLGAKGMLTPDIDGPLHDMPYNATIDANCGFYGSPGNPLWRNGNTCMEDYAVKAAAYAWRAAYLRKTGRSQWTSDRADAIDAIKMAFDTQKSICISKQNPGQDPDYYGDVHGPCNGTVSDLDDGTAIVIPFNHLQETTGYGLGLMTIIATAFNGLEAAGDPVSPWTDFGSSYNSIQSITRALFEEGQHAAAGGSTFNSNACYSRPNTQATSLTNDDVNPLNRNRSCVDQVTAYTPNMFPVRTFYSQAGFPIPSNSVDYQYTAAEFPFGTFNESDRGNFFGAARKQTYFDFTYDWLANPQNIPALENTNYSMGFRTSGFYYVTAEGNGGSNVVANRTAIGPWETFTMSTVDGRSLQDGSLVTIRTSANWLFSALYGGGYSMLADKTNVGPWETFRVSKIYRYGDRPGPYIVDGDQLALAAQSTGTTYYATAEGGGGSVVNVNRTAIGPWETFTFMKLEN